MDIFLYIWRDSNSPPEEKKCGLAQFRSFLLRKFHPKVRPNVVYGSPSAPASLYKLQGAGPTEE